MYQQQLAQNEQGNYTSSATKELDDLMASLSDFKVSPAEEETEHEWNNEKKKQNPTQPWRRWFPPMLEITKSGADQLGV